MWAALAAVVLAGAVAALWPSAQSSAPDVEAPRPPAPDVTPAQPPAPVVASAPAFQPERMADGSLRLDARFDVPGSGSEQDPFVIGWPLLASASESIDAAAGRLAPPGHIAFLDGQWVQISAFLAPPLWGERTSELLVMKNRWDGCCIGLPPTPFDCIEATLAAPITLGAKHSISFGTVRGRLVVQPFTAGTFLLGLYRLEQAQIGEMRGP